MEGFGDGGEAAVAVDAGFRVEGVGDGDDLVGSGGAKEILEAGADGGFGADDGGGEAGIDRFALDGIPELVHRFGVDRREGFDGLVADEAEEALLRSGEEAAGFSVCLGDDDGDGEGEVGLGELLIGRRGTGLEVVEVDLDRKSVV